MVRSTLRSIVALVAMLGVLTSCAGAGALGGAGDSTQLTIAIVSNPQMEDAIALSKQFTAEHPDIKLNFVSLPENEARAKITTSVSTGGGEYDVAMISNYETKMWAENKWLANLQPFMEAEEATTRATSSRRSATPCRTRATCTPRRSTASRRSSRTAKTCSPRPA